MALLNQQIDKAIAGAQKEKEKQENQLEKLKTFKENIRRRTDELQGVACVFSSNETMSLSTQRHPRKVEMLEGVSGWCVSRVETTPYNITVHERILIPTFDEAFDWFMRFHRKMMAMPE